jgi:hypothetical protein
LKQRVKSANPKIKIKENKFNTYRKEATIEINKQKNELFPDIYDGTGNKDERPKITKIFRKTASSKHGANKDNGGAS